MKPLASHTFTVIFLLYQFCHKLPLTQGTWVRRLRVSPPDTRPDHVYIVGVDVRAGHGRYRDTYMVTFSPRFQIENRSSHELLIAQRCFTTSFVSLECDLRYDSLRLSKDWGWQRDRKWITYSIWEIRWEMCVIIICMTLLFVPTDWSQCTVHLVACHLWLLAAFPLATYRQRAAVECVSSWCAWLLLVWRLCHREYRLILPQS